MELQFDRGPHEQHICCSCVASQKLATKAGALYKVDFDSSKTSVGIFNWPGELGQDVFIPRVELGSTMLTTGRVSVWEHPSLKITPRSNSFSEETDGVVELGQLPCRRTIRWKTGGTFRPQSWLWSPLTIVISHITGSIFRKIEETPKETRLLWCWCFTETTQTLSEIGKAQAANRTVRPPFKMASTRRMSFDIALSRSKNNALPKAARVVGAKGQRCWQIRPATEAAWVPLIEHSWPETHHSQFPIGNLQLVEYPAMLPIENHLSQ